MKIRSIFPKLDVRFIALTDHFDSDRPEDRNSISVPIRNMVNAMYARDFSKKQVASFELHSRLGDKKIISVPYGYQLNKERNRLEPDPATAPVVQIIFKWYIGGVGTGEICHRLNDIGVPPPSAYKNEGNTMPGKENLWSVNSLYHILKNQAYIGHRILGKRRSAQYKHIAPHETPPEEWYVHENTHEPIVSQEDFDKAQEMLCAGSRQIRQKLDGGKRRCIDRFHLKVRCKECGRTMMYFPKYDHDDVAMADYKCYAPAKSGDTSTGSDFRAVGKRYNGALRKDGRRRDCGKRVHEDFVRMAALDALQALLHTVGELKQSLRNTSDSGRLSDLHRELSNLRRRIADTRLRRETLYTDLTEGLLDKNDYLELKERLISEEQTLKEQLQTTESTLRLTEKKLRDFLHWAESLPDGDITDMEQSLFDDLIECICIADDKSVEIVFKCRDMIEEMMNL